MNEVTLQAFVDRINVGMMELEQVPVPYQEEVSNKMEVQNDNSIPN